MTISFNRTNKIHKETRYKRFKVSNDEYSSDKPDLICITLPDAKHIKMEILDNEICLWSHDFELILRTPIYDTAIIDAVPKRQYIWR